jgi:hypothetical protein
MLACTLYPCQSQYVSCGELATTAQQCRGQQRYGSAQGDHKSGSGTQPSGGKRPTRAERHHERRAHGPVKDPEYQQNRQRQREALDPDCVWMPAEDEEGNVEYKLRLKDPSTARLEQLVRCPLVSKRHAIMMRCVTCLALFS